MKKSDQVVKVKVTEARLVTLDLNQIKCDHIDPNEIPKVLEIISSIRNDIDLSSFKDDKIGILTFLNLAHGKLQPVDGDAIDNFFYSLRSFDRLLK